MTRIEPVFRLNGRSLVIQTEHHKLHVDRVTLAGSLQAMLATTDVAADHRLPRIGSTFFPCTAIHTIADGPSDITASHVTTVESHRGHLVSTDTLWHITREGCSLCSQWHTLRPAMRLTPLVSDISHHLEIVEHRSTHVLLRQYHRHPHIKGTIVLGDRLSRIDFLFIGLIAISAHIPIP